MATGHPRQALLAPAGAHELSLGQEALWFLQQLAPDSSAYNVSGAVRLHFPVHVEVLRSAVRRTVSRNSMLNCVFRSTGGAVRRCVGAARSDPELEVHELAGTDRSVPAFALELTRRPFRLDQERPVRLALLRGTGGPDILLMAAHHIVVDNISQLLVIREILAEYAALSAGIDRSGPDTGADFEEFVSRQRDFLASPRATSAREYWRAELTGLPDSDLPTDRPRPARYRFVGSEIDFELPRDALTGVAAAAAEWNTTVFAVLFSAFQLLLHRFSGRTEFLIGYPVTLRSARRYRQSIGYFVNTLPFRAHLEPDEEFETLVRRTGERLWRGLLHREYPFALLPRLAGVRRDPSQAGLISTMFIMNSSDPADPLSAALVPGRRVECAGLIVSELYLPQQEGQFDLSLQLLHAGAFARAQLKYNTALFTEDTARGLAGEFIGLLRSVTRTN